MYSCQIVNYLSTMLEMLYRKRNLNVCDCKVWKNIIIVMKITILLIVVEVPIIFDLMGGREKFNCPPLKFNSSFTNLRTFNFKFCPKIFNLMFFAMTTKFECWQIKQLHSNMHQYWDKLWPCWKLLKSIIGP